MTWHLNMSKGQRQDNRDTVILCLPFRHVEVPGYGLYPWWLLDTVILFLSSRHVEHLNMPKEQKQVKRV
jgi:hypothetical protein